MSSENSTRRSRDLGEVEVYLVSMRKSIVSIPTWDRNSFDERL